MREKHSSSRENKQQITHYISDSILLPELEVCHGHAGAVNVALAPTAGHAVQPAHVNAAAAPEGGSEHHVAVGVGHVAHVAAVIAHVEAG